MGFFHLNAAVAILVQIHSFVVFFFQMIKNVVVSFKHVRRLKTSISCCLCCTLFLHLFYTLTLILVLVLP